eukprot:4638603-Amphidinium_carterae.1
MGVFKRLGWKISQEKIKEMSESFTALGVVFDCSEVNRGRLVIRNKEGRVQEICALIREVLDRGLVSYKVLAQLR